MPRMTKGEYVRRHKIKVHKGPRGGRYFWGRGGGKKIYL